MPSQRASRPSRATTALTVVTILVLGLALGLWGVTRTATHDLPETTGQLTSHGDEVTGHERTWRTYRPDGHAGEELPLVIVLHGSLQDGGAIRELTGHRFDELADEEGFVVAYPDGVGDNWNECRRGGQWEAKERDVDDIGLVRHLVDATEGVDTDRVFVTGFSSGGQLALKVALEAPDIVAAIAPVAANPPTPENLGCADEGGAVPALFVAGTEDPMNPYGGGEVSLMGVGDRGGVRSAADGLTWWQDRGETTPGSRLLSIEGGGHQYPSPGARGPIFLGSTTNDDVPEQVWDYFASVPEQARD